MALHSEDTNLWRVGSCPIYFQKNRLQFLLSFRSEFDFSLHSAVCVKNSHTVARALDQERGSGTAGNALLLSQVALHEASLPLALPSSECGADADGDKTVTFTLCLLLTQTTVSVTPALPTDVKDEETDRGMEACGLFV